MEVAIALKKYAESRGYSNKKGRRPAGEKVYRAEDCMYEFNFKNLFSAKNFLSLNEADIKSAPDEVFVLVAAILKDICPDIWAAAELKFIDIKTDKVESPEEAFPTIGSMNMTPEEEKFNALTVDDMKVLKNDAEERIKMTPEMPTEIHVSNRLYRVEGKVKEIKDAVQSWRNHYKDERLAAFTLMESTLKMKNQDYLDPLTIDFFKERSMFVEILDIIIDKLDKV